MEKGDKAVVCPRCQEKFTMTAQSHDKTTKQDDRNEYPLHSFFFKKPSRLFINLRSRW